MDIEISTLSCTSSWFLLTTVHSRAISVHVGGFVLKILQVSIPCVRLHIVLRGITLQRVETNKQTMFSETVFFFLSSAQCHVVSRSLFEPALLKRKIYDMKIVCIFRICQLSCEQILEVPSANQLLSRNNWQEMFIIQMTRKKKLPRHWRKSTWKLASHFKFMVCCVIRYSTLIEGYQRFLVNWPMDIDKVTFKVGGNSSLSNLFFVVSVNLWLHGCNFHAAFSARTDRNPPALLLLYALHFFIIVYGIVRTTCVTLLAFYKTWTWFCRN